MANGSRSANGNHLSYGKGSRNGAKSPDVTRKGGRGSMRRRPDTFARASAVVVRQADGSTAIVPSLTPRQLAMLMKERRAPSPRLKERVRERDGDQCRYCGRRCDSANTEYDHVVPVGLGGATSLRNLVLACGDCNQRKGMRVWTPRPVPRR